MTARHGGLRRQVGVHEYRHDRATHAKMRQWNTERVIDLRRAAERRIETLRVDFAHECKRHFARDSEAEITARERPARFATDMQREWRRALQEELLRVIVRHRHPHIRFECCEMLADFRS